MSMLNGYIILFAILACLSFVSHWLLSQKIIPLWHHKKNLNWLDNRHKQDTYALFNDLYAHTNSFRVAKRSKRHHRLEKDIRFTYGEIDFIAFGKLLDLMQPQPGELFVDFGSGAGKAVFCTALLYPDVKSVGIELLPGLHQLSLRLLNDFEALMADHPRLQATGYDIEFIQSDMLNIDLSQTTLLFINATCYGFDFLNQISQSLNAMPIGSRVMITTHPMQNANFACTHTVTALMSWGMCPVRIYQRTQ